MKCPLAKLDTYPAVFDSKDDSQPGKWEFQTTIKNDAKALNLTNKDLDETIRAAYYGEEVMRLQRGRHEVKLMVRYPRDERRSLANFDNIRVRMQPSKSTIISKIAQGNRSLATNASGPAERPLTELADVKVNRGYSEIHRLNQLRSITITADVKEKLGNADEIVRDMKNTFFPALLKKYSELRLNWEGQQEQTRESVGGLKVGLSLALVAMFVLLTFEFRSYMQPIMILLIIPYGIIGAIFGHLLLHLDITIFSLFGLVALSGVVINDSIVLIDFMNHRVRSGVPLKDALVDAGRRRFRPVLLTSVTTVGGLLPIVLEKSFQAQVLVPMATSLAFGLMFTTMLVLILVPTMYLVYVRLVVGDASRMVVPEMADDGAIAQFIGLEQSAPASANPTSREQTGSTDIFMLDATETGSHASPPQNPNGDTQENDESELDQTTRRPRHEIWPPPSHLPRSGGGQD